MPNEATFVADDPAAAPGRSGWRGILLIAATYVYFLIFAQFGFLKRLDELGVAGAHLKLVMGAMAAGGILASLLAPRLALAPNPASRLRCALTGCALAALLSTLPLNLPASVAIAALIGLSLGLLTVTLVANLELWIGRTNPLLKVGLGTGTGYFLCNIPALFTAAPRTIALCAALVPLAALLLSGTLGGPAQSSHGPRPRQTPATPFLLVLAWFTALIWLDSAAFFIIQNSPALKSGTWQGASHLWRTGAIHLLAALLSAWLLARRGLSFTLLAAFAALAGACLLLLHPANATLAAFLYPTGVSFYSVALVAAPSFLLPSASTQERARRTGWIYAIAGWSGSALGIGMAQNLHHVPAIFVAAAAVLFFGPRFWPVARAYLPQTMAVALSLALALLIEHALPRSTVQKDLIAQGRRVYIAEGCIHCHSQYVRPHSADVLLWGPTQDLEVIRREKPPLIGNRRQGPDLSEVGSRRSPLWLRIHFMDPRALSYHSVMPSYAALFHQTGPGPSHGDALLAYVESLHSAGSGQHLQQALTSWTPATQTTPDPATGQRLFAHYCATCHTPQGTVRQRWGADFQRLPPNLQSDPLLDVSADLTPAAQRLRIERIVKFGIPGTNMPGHEYLPDSQIEALAAHVLALRRPRTDPSQRP